MTFVVVLFWYNHIIVCAACRMYRITIGFNFPFPIIVGRVFVSTWVTVQKRNHIGYEINDFILHTKLMIETASQKCINFTVQDIAVAAIFMISVWFSAHPHKNDWSREIERKVVYKCIWFISPVWHRKIMHMFMNGRNSKRVIKWKRERNREQ